MLEIRGEMISILDPNYTREQETLSDRSDKKVLIFTANRKNYGLTVDSINSIVNFNEEDKIPVPEMANTSSGKLYLLTLKMLFKLMIRIVVNMLILYLF